MRQFPLEMHHMAPGRVIEWHLRSTAVQTAARNDTSARKASFNQDKHFTVAEETRGAEDQPASWLAVTFEVAGPLDGSAMAQALLDFTRRHEVLRSTFHRMLGDLTCEPMPIDELALDLHEVGTFGSSELLSAFLAERFTGSIDTLTWPLFIAGAVLRQDSATVFLAFDHIICDGMSMPIVVHEVLTAYEAALHGEEPALPPAPSYLDFADEQRRRYLSIDARDSRLGYWKSFVARNGEFFPRFPLDLGAEPGRMYPIVNEASTLLDAEDAQLFDKQCLAVGGKPFMGVLAAAAVCLHEAGGPGVYRGFMPVSERGRGPWTHSVGWFVNTMPIEFDASRGQDFAQVVGKVGAAFTEMIGHIDVPFVRAWELLAPEEFAARNWPYPVNFFSYIDMRKCPGAERHDDWQPTAHVWAARVNGACTWFQRDADGLHTNSIYVDTARARRTMGDLQSALRQKVLDITHSGIRAEADGWPHHRTGVPAGH